MNAYRMAVEGSRGTDDSDHGPVGVPSDVKGSAQAPTDQDSFTERLSAHRGILFKIANSYGFGAGEREDLVQEICLQLWRSYPAYDRGRRFSTWMYRVALNTAISHARSAEARGRHVVPLEGSGAGERAGATAAREPDERVERLYGFLRALPKLDRALVLLYLEDHSYREIAEILGISETNVGTKIARLKQTMRREMVRQQEIPHGPR
jgi:RNA polymerase sigma-70 factor (ECF subfamily)